MRSLEAGLHRANDAESAGTPLNAPEVQLGLMLAAYQQKHGHEADLPRIASTALEENSETVFDSARDEWVAEAGELSLADKFRFYAEENADERIDVHDEAALAALLDNVRTWKSKTLH